MGAKIRFAITEADRRAVYRFRYEVYVNEMKRVQKYADHDKCMIEEPLDETGYILIAEDTGRTVGTARFNVGVDKNFGLYEDLYGLKEFEPFYPSAVSITTKLMVSPDYRRSPLPLRLAVRCYSAALKLGNLFDFIDCNDHLIPFFKKLGYQQVFPDVFHPEYGRVVPMVLPLLDRQHLENVGSPFAKHARKIADPRDSAAFFREKFLSKSNGFAPSLELLAAHNSGARHAAISC